MNNDTTPPPVDAALAFKTLASSLRKMAEFYLSDPVPRTIRPVDAIRVSLLDTAVAVDNAVEGKEWVKPGVWEVPTVTAP